MTTYETTFILEPGLDENRVNEEIDKVSHWIKDMGGEVLEVQRWGKRRLSYEIHRKRDGIYTMIMHDSPNTVVREVERRLGLNEAVLRLLSVIHVPASVLQQQAEAAAAAAAAAGEDNDD